MASISISYVRSAHYGYETIALFYCYRWGRTDYLSRRRLHIAQPPLSQALKALEAELGVQLFERIPSGIRITEAGALLLQRSYQISNMFDTIAEDMASFRGGREGILKIGTVSSSGSILINENFMAFREHYPKVKFNLYEGNSYQIIEYLEKGIIEIGIVLHCPLTTINLKKFAVRLHPWW